MKTWLFYLLYLSIIFELFAWVAIPVLKKRMIFESSYFPPKDWNSEYFDPKLGWLKKDRLVQGGAISCFGDSFTYGDEVKANESWVSQLNQSGFSASNFGVQAYGTDQAYLWALENLDNKSSVFLLSFISENLNRNLTNYRLFYYPGSKGSFLYTKPRFKIQGNAVVLKPNPIQSKIDLKRLWSFEYLNRIGKEDFFFQKEPLPLRDRFPKSQVFFFKLFWRQFFESYIQGRNFLDAKYRKHDWSLEAPLLIQDHILSQFKEKVLERGKLPVIMHLPDYKELKRYLNEQEVPLSIKHTRQFCQDKQLMCWFPLLERKRWKLNKIDDYFSSGKHYSPQGNQVIFEFVKSKIESLSSQGLWPVPTKSPQD